MPATTRCEKLSRGPQTTSFRDVLRHARVECGIADRTEASFRRTERSRASDGTCRIVVRNRQPVTRPYGLVVRRIVVAIGDLIGRF